MREIGDRCWMRRSDGRASGYTGGAGCVRSLDDSLIPAIRITYRISLRSSSLQEPRYPSLGVVFSYDISW